MSLHSTILIIGATSGIGHSLAHALHTRGKTIIATGRRTSLLSSLAASHPGLQTRSFDIADLPTLPSDLHELTASFPDIDTVIVAAGTQSCFYLNEPELVTPEEIATEVNTNLTAPIILAHHFVPFFLAKKDRGIKCSFVFFTSAFSFFGVPYFPVYGPTKAGLFNFAVALRAQLAAISSTSSSTSTSTSTSEDKEPNISITCLIPPYVNTGLDTAFKDRLLRYLGREVPQQPVEEFTEVAIRELGLLDKEDGRARKEVPVGHLPEMVVEKWREAFGGVMEHFGVKG